MPLFEDSSFRAPAPEVTAGIVCPVVLEPQATSVRCDFRFRVVLFCGLGVFLGCSGTRTTTIDGAVVMVDSALAPGDVAAALSVDGTAGDATADTGATSDTSAAACTPEGERHYADPGDYSHATSIAGITYNSNPPSSGSHCGDWGQRGTYSVARPLPRCNWLHNLEHGWVVLLYNCPMGCPEIVAGLQAVAKAASDPDCSERRTIVTPDPALDVTVAATAWRFTWKSGCWDAAAQASLLAFANAHLGTRGESGESYVCSDGGVGP